ncbi:MAG: hypothetical protein HUN04_17090 [Desulfobacter sp.]|nr:MAG: hypothetical protein HUN04_17090 [Desulfobacter sp.]
MKYEIQDESKKYGRFLIKLSGPFSIDSQISMLRELVSHSNWRKGLNQVIDARELEFENYNINEIDSAALSVALLKKHFENSRHAIILSKEADGLMKSEMFNFLTGDKVGWVSRIFTEDEYENALTWTKK